MPKRLFPTITLAVLLAAAPLSAQVLPGFDPDTDADAARFKAYALDEFQATLAGWTEAVQAGDVDAVMRFYTRDALVYLGGLAYGRAEARPLVAVWLATVQDVRTSLSDFDASGSLSYGTARIVVNPGDPANRREGTMMLVVKRGSPRWLIRSQAVVLE